LGHAWASNSASFQRRYDHCPDLLIGDAAWTTGAGLQAAPEGHFLTLSNNL
jgi:hypothetical protein